MRTALFVLLAGMATGWTGPAAADGEVGFDTTHTVFHERGGPLDMTVYSPSADMQGDIGKHVTVGAGWEADIVSGASVAVVDAPSTAVDAITSATTLTDQRHTVGGDIQIRGDFTRLDLAYNYGRESDYRSHSFRMAAAAELFERNTTLEASYARGWDQVCNLAQPDAQEAVDRQRMPSSQGCFEADDRASPALDLQTFQGSWTQAWTPILATQLTFTTRLLNGYQANPYRGVWLGRTVAQEHHPDNRARYAAGLNVRLWLKPLQGALRAFGRLYRDTWDVESVTAELGYEQTVQSGLRIRLRGRFYIQNGAFFYSDDYVRFPQGAFFTGDRELSPMKSVTAGARLQWNVPSDEQGNVLGVLDSLDLVLKGDFIKYYFDDFNYGNTSVPNDVAVIATLGLEALF